MKIKTLSIISIGISVFVLLLIGVFVFFIAVVALNGFTGREGGAALTVLGVCGGVGAIVSAALAGQFTTFLMIKYNWNRVAAVGVSVLAGAIMGGFLYAIAFAFSLLVAQAFFYR